MQCQGITKNNYQCLRHALPDSHMILCRQHQTIADKKEQQYVMLQIQTETDRLKQLGHEWRRNREKTPGTYEHYKATTNFKKFHYGWNKNQTNLIGMPRF